MTVCCQCGRPAVGEVPTGPPEHRWRWWCRRCLTAQWRAKTPITLRPLCAVCDLRIVVDPYGGSGCWIHLSDRANRDHQAVRQ